MGTVRIESVNTQTTGTLVEVYESGSAGQAPTLVATHRLDAATPLAEMVIGPSRYLVVRESTEDEAEAKTIDNWLQTPPSPGDS